MLERSFKAPPKLKCELPTEIELGTVPLMEISSLAEDIHVKTQEALQNTDLNMQELLKINKMLWSIHSELVNNTSKLTEIGEHIKNKVSS